jgi:hypothetical protein
MFRLLFLFWLFFHPVHVSLTSIDYIRETGNFKGFVRIYLDDFLLDCKQHGYEIEQERLIAGEPSSKAVLEKYLTEKLIVKVNGKTVKGNLENVSIADNEIDVELLYENRHAPRTITITSTIMTDLYSDQSNMIIVKVNDFEEGVKLTPELTEQTFKID